VDVAGCLQFALVKNCRGYLAALPQDGEFNDLTPDRKYSVSSGA
jgi:hypothetical protein